MADRPPLALDPGSDPPRRLGEPRLDALREWVRATDQRNVEAMKSATKLLRQFGISICAIGKGGRP